jgi:TonB-linked SusC/RagA family outer membrane protein
VFGVRGANGVILVTTRRGKEGEAKISVSSKYGVQVPTRLFEMADSYTYGTIMNERDANDGKTKDQFTFNDYTLERFRLGDDPIMYPNIDWKDYFMKNSTMQTQHNVNISGGTETVKYFISAGFLYQNGILKQLPGQSSDENYAYKRYNYRANLDIDLTSTTLLKLGIGGIVGDKNEPRGDQSNIWFNANWSQPFSSPGIIDNRIVKYDGSQYPGILLVNPIDAFYNKGFVNQIKNNMNIDLALQQNLDFITEGLKFEIKGAYNTNYTYTKKRYKDSEYLVPFYKTTLDDPNMDIEDPAFDKTIVYRVKGTNSNYGYSQSSGKARDWYFEASLRYAKKLGNHNFSTLFLYNQSKKYYPSSFPELPTAYVGLVGRQTYDYKSKYLAEVNVGYNGSENFAPGKRYGFFPAFSLGYVVSEEAFMKKQKVVDYFKIRATMGLVGNDNIGNNRYLYLPDSYKVDQTGAAKTNNRNGIENGYIFGDDTQNHIKGSKEQRIGNPNVTWEKALKKNLGIDINFFNNRLKVSADIFDESREDILIKRKTVPGITGLSSNILPVVNMGKVDNHGYELEFKWKDKAGDFDYWVNANLSYSKNKIVYQDEIEPNESYMWKTGHAVGTPFGFVADGFYGENEFKEDGDVIDGLPTPSYKVYPGDVKYRDLNDDGIIDNDDQTVIGKPNRPAYVYGINYGVSWKGAFLTMNWSGAEERSIIYNSYFRRPFSNESRGLMQFHVDERWTPETAETASFPRISTISKANNDRTSTIYVRDGSYLRLKTVTLGYTFANNQTLKMLGIESLKLELSGYNLFTFDSFEVMDPEAQPDKNQYPLIKIYNVGLNLTF